VPYKRRGQTLAVEAVAGTLASTNLSTASNNVRYLAALTADPSAADPTGISEGTGSSMRPQIPWAATNTGATPVEIASSGEIFIGPFNSTFTITHVALLTTAGAVSTGTVLSTTAISTRVVNNGDRLRFAAGSIKITAT
jgi:hypothetical protein